MIFSHLYFCSYSFILRNGLHLFDLLAFNIYIHLVFTLSLSYISVLNTVREQRSPGFLLWLLPNNRFRVLGRGRRVASCVKSGWKSCICCHLFQFNRFSVMVIQSNSLVEKNLSLGLINKCLVIDRIRRNKYMAQ